MLPEYLYGCDLCLSCFVGQIYTYLFNAIVSLHAINEGGILPTRPKLSTQHSHLVQESFGLVLRHLLTHLHIAD